MPDIKKYLPRVRARNRRGRCYELALKGLSKQGDSTGWRLVHGECDTRGIPHGHAWLRRGDDIYDPVHDRLFTAAEFDDAQNGAKALKVYTLVEASGFAADTGMWGPWETPDVILAGGALIHKPRQ